METGRRRATMLRDFMQEFEIDSASLQQNN